MTTLSVTTPLRIWNHAIYGYETVPDDPLVPTKPRPNTSSSSSSHGIISFGHVSRFLLILSITILGIVSLVFYANIGAHVTPDETHQETVIPTLLSVINPNTKTLINALSNPLYETLRHADIVEIMDHKDSVIDSDKNSYQRRRRHLKGQELPRLLLDKTQLQTHDDSITLTWTVGRDHETGNILIQEEDILALYCDDHDHFLEAATIAQARATSLFQGGSSDSWYIPSFPALRQTSCHFELYTESSSSTTSDDSNSNPEHADSSMLPKQLIRIARSEPLTIPMAKETPTGIHLALAESPSQMVIQFITGDVPDTLPIVRFSQVHDDDTTNTNNNNNNLTTVTLVSGTSDTYTSEDLCQAPGNLTQAGKFYPPGMLHTIQLKDLSPNTQYQYQVALAYQKNDTGIVHNTTTTSTTEWSGMYTFQTPPFRGANDSSFSYIVYGDQGCPHMGWKGGKEWLSAMMQREQNVTAIHHFGDISYARGAAHVWDGWWDMIQPFSVKVPLMIAIGNHEYDHTDGGGIDKDPSGVETVHGYMPSWGNFKQDSGGECGVTMAKRFQMPTSVGSNGVFWYSFDYGNVHTIVISSEHDLSPGSPQYAFLEADLQRTDRNVTPWVILESHRPLYEGEASGGFMANGIVGQAMREEIEDLLFIHQVDLVLAGHYHEYHRTCDGLYRGVCNMKGGPMHITVGSAGAKLDDGFETFNDWTAHFIKGEFGYGRITVANNTHLHFEFVLHGDTNDDRGGKVEDDVWILRDRK